MALGSCQAAVFAATEKVPHSEIRKWDRSSMILAFRIED